MTNDKNKIYWNLNWILCAIVFIILAVVFIYRYFKIGVPVEANWTEEVFKYILMWPTITVICWGIAWVPFKMLSSYIAKKRGGAIEE